MVYFTSILIMGSIATILGIILVFLDHYLANYGECSIKVNEDINFTVIGGEPLSSYLIANRIFIPSACGGKATCGFCKVTVLEGGGPVLPTEKPFLTKREILSNIRLACQVKVKSDIRVIIAEEYLSVQEFKATVTEIRSLTYDTKEITLKLRDPGVISFRPGQYIQLRVPGTSEYRAYSIASPPSQNDVVRLVVRLIPGGLCSTYIHKSLRVGDIVCFTGPYGELVLQEDSMRDIVCVAGGCGMAPFVSIIRHLFETGAARNVVYFFGAQAKSDLYYTEEFQRLAEEHENFKFIVALSAPGRGSKWTGEMGLIHRVLDRYIDSGKNMEAYLCGPPAMIDAAVRVLASKGVRQEDIFVDKF
jgi:Na+-transporting NADH:ubiquinone oxidoreductase subunit F